MCHIRPGEQSEQTPGQPLNGSLQEQITGTEEHTGQAGELGDREDHLQHDTEANINLCDKETDLQKKHLKGVGFLCNSIACTKYFSMKIVNYLKIYVNYILRLALIN